VGHKITIEPSKIVDGNTKNGQIMFTDGKSGSGGYEKAESPE